MWELVISAFLGGLVALGGWGIRRIFENNRNRRTLKSALAAEIAMLVVSMRWNRYAADLREHVAALRASGAHHDHHPYFVHLEQSYFTVYDASAGRLGELDTDKAVEVIAFYHQAKALIDAMSIDTSEDGNPAEVDWAIKRYEMLAEALDRLCDVGESLSARLASAQVMDQFRRIANQLGPPND